MKINVNTITIGLIVGGIILSSSLYVKAFTPTNNTAACVTAATLAVNTANAANANKERERGNDKEPGLKEYVFAAIDFYIVIHLLYWWLTLIQKRR